MSDVYLIAWIGLLTGMVIVFTIMVAWMRKDVDALIERVRVDGREINRLNELTGDLAQRVFSIDDEELYERSQRLREEVESAVFAQASATNEIQNRMDKMETQFRAFQDRANRMARGEE